MAGRRFDDTEFCWLTEFTDSLKGYVIEGERFCSTYHIIVYHRARTDFWGRCLRRNGHDYGLSRFSEPDRKQCRRVMAWLCCSGQQLRRNPVNALVRKMHNRCFDAASVCVDTGTPNPLCSTSFGSSRSQLPKNLRPQKIPENIPLSAREADMRTLPMHFCAASPAMPCLALLLGTASSTPSFPCLALRFSSTSCSRPGDLGSTCRLPTGLRSERAFDRLARTSPRRRRRFG
jgi:hypothetical protein